MAKSVSGGFVDVDNRAFNAALQQYVQFTTKESVVALNGKFRDLMWRACYYTPIMRRASVAQRGINNLRAYSVATLVRKSGVGSLKGESKPFDFTTSEVVKEMARIRKPARGYLKSGFAKAGKQFAATAASTAIPQTIKSFAQVKAFVSRAFEQFLKAQADISWPATDAAGDKSEKQAILDGAFAQAKSEVYQDMMRYLRGKLSKQAAMHSVAQ